MNKNTPSTSPESPDMILPRAGRRIAAASSGQLHRNLNLALALTLYLRTGGEGAAGKERS